MGIRTDMHELIDELADEELSEARRLLLEVRDGGFGLSSDELQELKQRIDRCAQGEGVDARRLLTQLRSHRDLKI